MDMNDTDYRGHYIGHRDTSGCFQMVRWFSQYALSCFPSSSFIIIIIVLVVIGATREVYGHSLSDTWVLLLNLFEVSVFGRNST